MCVCVSDLDVLQPVGGLWGRGQFKVVSGRHPCLQALQLGGGPVSGHVTHQVALELVGQEVDVDGHRVTYGHVPGEGGGHTLSTSARTKHIFSSVCRLSAADRVNQTETAQKNTQVRKEMSENYIPSLKITVSNA